MPCNGGTVSVIGVYGGFVDKSPIGAGRDRPELRNHPPDVAGRRRTDRWANVPLPLSLVDPLTKTGPLARLGHTMVYDSVNERIVMLGTTVLTTAETGYTEPQGDDVWAYDVASNTWTELVPSRQ